MNADADNKGLNPVASAATPLWRLWGARVLLCVCLAWFVWLLARNFDTVRRYDWHFSAPWLLGGLLLLSAAMHLLPAGTRLLIGGLGYQIEAGEMNWMYFSSQLGKYLPGSLWGYVGMSLYYRERAVPLSVMSACFLYELLLIVFSSLLVGFAALQPLLPAWGGLCGVVLLAGGVLGVLLFPVLPLRILGWVPRFQRLREVRASSCAFAHAVRLTLLLDLLFWLLCGTALWMLFRGAVATSDCTLLELTTAFPVAWTAGFLSFIMPGGIGVREGAFVLVLKRHFTVEIATALALLARVQWMLAEWTALAFAYLRMKLRR